MKKSLLIIPVTLLSFCSLIGCGKKAIDADLVVYNNVFTAEFNKDGSSKLAQAFAVKDGKYVYVGSKEGAKAYIKEGKTKVIDGNGSGLVIPGATEGHGHYFSGVGLNSQLPGSEKNYNEVLDILRTRVSEGITQFVSFGWHAAELNDRKARGDNFANEVENIAPGIPVILIDNSGHGAICNKTALQMAGITKDTVIRGGSIGLDATGNPSGFVADQVVYYAVEKAISKPLNESQYKTACENGMNQLLKFGYTNTLDAFSNMYDPTGLYKALKDMDDRNDLKLNVTECYNIRSYDAAIYKDRVKEVEDIIDNYSSSHVRPNFIKIFVDGVVESGTGWMLEPYTNGKYGNVIWNQAELDAITTYANSKGILIHAHTYGDAACKSAIDSFVFSNEFNGNQFRNCLAHVRNIASDDVDRVAENNIPIAENLLWHCDFDKEDPVRASILNNIGEERFYSGYPMKSLLEKGVCVSSSTDAPAAVTTEGSVLNVVEVSVTGQEPYQNANPFGTNELLSVEEALTALTINGAWQLGLEKERGSIKVGKYADFLIFDKNILNYQGEQLRTIHEAKILNTFFEGEIVYTVE